MAMTCVSVFYPRGQVALAATTTTSRATLSGNGELGGSICQVRNRGPALAYIKFGSSSVEAATTDLPIEVNSWIDLPIPGGATSVAAITEAGGASLAFICGSY